MSRFNLRSRRSLKLSSQSQCKNCQRQFFAREDDDDDDSDNENKSLCNDCVASIKTTKGAKAKKQPPKTPAKRVKSEQNDPDYNDITIESIVPVQVLQNDETKKIQLLTLNNNKKPNATKWDPPILDTDTKETIRDKFPKASEYEMEFLAFLARK